MSKTKIFLTGGNGFIGKNILEMLGDKYEFFAPSSDELDLLDIDALLTFLKEISPDIVIHAAAIGTTRKSASQPGITANNLRMFYNLCACKDYFDRMIIFGSGAEYDKRRPISMIYESDFGSHIPADEYGLAKFTMAKLADNLDFITHLRFFGVFGKYEDYETRFISNAICKKIFGLPITINKNVFFDYIYVNDLVKILVYFIDNHPPEKFYNIGVGKPVDLLTLANIVNSIGEDRVVINVANAGLNNEYTCNVDRLKVFIGNYKYISYFDAINEMFGYYLGIKDVLDKKIIN